MKHLHKGSRIPFKYTVEYCIYQANNTYLLLSTKGYCRDIEKGYTGCQMIDLPSLGLPEHICNFFWLHFHFFILKSMSCQFLILLLICKWWVMAAGHSPPPVLYMEMYDCFFNRYITPKMTNMSVTSAAAGLPPLFKLSGIGTNRQMISDQRCWSAAVIHRSQSCCQMRKHKSMLCKWHQKELKICSGNTKVFWSVNWNQL